MRFNKLCDLEDFSDPELVAILRDVCAYKEAGLPGFPKGAEHRKDWEVAMAIRAFREFGALGPEATVLGVAAGTEDTLFYLTRHVRQVFATDRYMSAAEWHGTAPPSMIVDPSAVALDTFDPTRLVVQHMDARSLRYPDNFFDGVFSSSSIEHVGQMMDVAGAAYEMGRVLKPGGVMSLSTELRLDGPTGGIGWPGQTLVFPVEDLRRYIIEASGLEPVDELDLHVSDETRSYPRELTAVIADRELRAVRDPDVPDYARWDFPHTVLHHGGYEFTSVHLTLRKPSTPPAVSNDWAAPSAATLAAVKEWDRSILRPSAAAPAATPSSGGEPQVPAPAWPSKPAWDPTSRDPVWRRLGRLGQVATQLTEVDHLRNQADEALRAIADRRDALRPVIEAGHKRQARIGGAAVGPSSRVHWSCVALTGPGGLAYEMMIDPDAADPLAAGLAAGVQFDQTLIELMLDLVKPGDMILDIGAHLGQFALPAAAAGCKVLAVEASPLNAALLRASAARNGFHDLRVVHACVGDRPGTVEFLPNGPWGRVARAHEAGPAVTVAAVTMDDLLFELGWGPLAFVKIDVEGSELAVIDGMARTLATPAAPPVLFESNGHTLKMYGSGPGDVLTRMESLGYTSHVVEPRRLVRFSPDEFQPQTIVDFLAFKQVPAALEGWRVDGLLSLGERVARVLADAALPVADHRAYIAGALASADQELLSQAPVTAVLDRLRCDPDEAVRAAAAWWGDRPPSGPGDTDTTSEERR